MALFLLVAFLVSGCKKSPETPFYENGVSFNCPPGWKIDETEDMDEMYYICVEKDGYNDSGLLLMTVFDDANDVQEYVEVYMENMEDQGIFDNLTFGNSTPASYGSYSGQVVKYTASVLSVPHQGEIFSFEANGRYACVVRQEANEDHKKNKEGFKILEETLVIEPIGQQDIPEPAFIDPTLEDDEQEEEEELVPDDVQIIE